MARFFAQPTETTDFADALDADQRMSNDIWSLGFGHNADQDIAGLSHLLKPPAPLPVVVSPRPEVKPITTPDQMQGMWQSGNGDASVQTLTQDTSGVEPGSTPPGSAVSSAPAGSGAVPPAGAQPSAMSSAPSSPAPAGGEIDNSSRASFARTAYPYALQAAGGDPELAKRLLASAISENGTVGNGGAIGVGNNFGGIKYDPQASGSNNLGTWESEGGQRVNQNANFAAYRTPQDGFAAIPRFIQTNFPKEWAQYQQTHDAAQLYRDINAGGYATDQGWHNAIESINAHDIAPNVPMAQPVARAQTGGPPWASTLSSTAANVGSDTATSGPTEDQPMMLRQPLSMATSGPDTTSTPMISPYSASTTEPTFQDSQTEADRSAPWGALPSSPPVPVQPDPEASRNETVPGLSTPQDVSPDGQGAYGQIKGMIDRRNYLVPNDLPPDVYQGNASPMTDASSGGMDASVPAPAPASSGAGAFQDDYSDAGSHTLDVPDTSGPVVGPTQPGPSIVQRIQDAGGAAQAGLTPILDAAGKVKAWIHDEAQGAVAGAVNVPGLTDAANAAGAVAGSIYRGDVGRALLDAGDAQNADTKQMLVRQQAIWDQAMAWEAQNGTPDRTGGVKAVTDPAWRAANPDLAAEYDEINDKMLIAAGQASAPMEVAKAAEPALQAARPVIQSGIAAVRSSVSRVGQALDENAARVAALDAERAGQGSLAAPGVFGVAPPEAGSAAADVARPRFVPPEVRAQITPNVEIPDDPRLQAAVQAVGGRITDQGIEVHVTRAQGADAAGGVATRGGVFVEAVPEGGKSNYARSADNPNAVGGATVIPPTRTTYRKPLVIDDAPGAGQGFNQAADALGVIKRPTELPPGYTLIRDRMNPGAEWGVIPEGQTHARPMAGSHATPEEAVAAAVEQLGESASNTIDEAIQAARTAGPEGSPERAQALKDLVSKYGGDPKVIDDLIKIRGVDAAESQWAIKENIVAANARRQGYDGVFTVKDQMRPASEVAHLPEIQQARAEYERAYQAHDEAQQAAREAQQRYWELDNERRVDPSKTDAYYQASEDAFKIGNRAERLSSEMAKAQLRLNEAEDAARRTNKITEIFDVQQGRNPTPPPIAPHPLAKTAQRDFERAQGRWRLLSDRLKAIPGNPLENGGEWEPWLSQQAPPVRRMQQQWDQALTDLERTHKIAQEVGQNPTIPVGAPGYSLHPDVVRPTAPEPGSTTAAGMAGVVPVPVRGEGDRLARVNAMLSQGAASAISGGVGAATAQQLGDPNDPNRALKGFAAGAIAPYALSRGAAALARRAGREIPEAEGALGVFGSTPKLNRPAESANPNIRDMARQMSGDYKPVGEERPFSERVVAALTDRYAIHANVPAEANARIAQAGGTPVVERLAERVRENPNSAAAQRSREELAPALQAWGKDDEWGAQYLAYRHNLDIAKGKAQDAYDAAIQAGRSPQVAQMAADRVRTSRQFSGGMTEKDITQALTDMAQELGPQRFQNITDHAQAFWDAGRKNLQAKLDEGIISQEAFDYYTQKYPHYVRTDIADYAEKGPANPSPGGKTLGISSDGIKPISMEGTSKDRVNPIMSTIDSIYATENAVARSRAARDLVNVRDADPTLARLFPEVAPDVQTWQANRNTMAPPDYSLRNGEQKLTQWDNGASRQFVVPKEYAQLLTPTPGALLGDQAAPVRTFFGILKQLITTHNPAFQYLLSPVRDVGDATIAMQTATGAAAGGNPLRQAAASAGALPEAVMRLVQAAPAAFEGALSNQYGPRAAELLKAGAGFEGRPMGERGLRSAMTDLKKTGGIQIDTPGDALRVLRSFVTLGAERFGGRMEMIPRIAAANMERGRGGDLLSQSTAYKDATIDFLRGGWLTRQASVPVMFLNPTVQSAAQARRLYAKSPAAYMAALITTVGIPTILNEAWNRSDPQRAKDYADRPDYLKNTGLVIEAPGLPQGAGRVGEALPTSVYLPLGNHAFAARLFREALGLADQATGLITPPAGATGDKTSPAYWAKVGADTLNMFSPLKGGDATAVAGGLVPPGIRDVIELGQNKNLYTGSTIATDRTDENASTLSKGLASGANAVLGTEVRPSQVEHEVTGPLGYPGRLAAAASDLAVGRQHPEQHPIQDTPVAGGLVRSFVRDSGGQQMQNARDEMFGSDVMRIVHDAGLRSDQVSGVNSMAGQVPLTRDEQAQAQRLMNTYLADMLKRAASAPGWAAAPAATKQYQIRGIAESARQSAEAEVIRNVSPAERARRATAVKKAS